MVRWLIIFLAVCQTAVCQSTIEGRVVDAESGKPIPFVSIGILGTSKGTSSNLNGQFTLSISKPVTLKFSCVGYESLVINSTADLSSIMLKPFFTQLKEIVIFDKDINPKKVVRKAFANIAQNYTDQPFMQKFFYRHYCKDDSVYGRLIEAFVDVWKHEGYRSFQKSAGQKEEIRVTQLRRSVDKSIMAQGHDPISIGCILEADIVGYQTGTRSEHMSFFTDVSNLKTDFQNYSFTFKGVTTYDGQEVYEISYTYKSDSVLTTSGKYLALTQATGSLFIATDTYAFVKTEDVKNYENNILRTSTYYRKYNNRYYPYHFVREGIDHLSDNSTHSFHIELISVETRTDAIEKFTGREPGKEQLMMIPYDSAFWSSNTILKTTPLEDDIIRDLGGGTSLNRQFYLYRQYELNLREGGKNASEKFNWLKEDSKGKRILYLIIWDNDCKTCLVELEIAKQLHKRYLNKITFVLLSLDDNEIQWQQTLSKYNLYSNGIINYRIGKDSAILDSFHVKDIPAFILISRKGELFDSNAKHPGNPLLEEDFKFLLGISN